MTRFGRFLTMRPEKRIFLNTRLWSDSALSLGGVRTVTLRIDRLSTSLSVSSKDWPVAPVAYQVIFEPGKGPFREFESPRVHTRISSRALFLLHN